MKLLQKYFYFIFCSFNSTQNQFMNEINTYSIYNTNYTKIQFTLIS
jgi:hypothetical protein